MAHCANSRLVCKISGDVMNENNPPMMLPNGYVYGYNVRAWVIRAVGWAGLGRAAMWRVRGHQGWGSTTFGQLQVFLTGVPSSDFVGLDGLRLKWLRAQWLRTLIALVEDLGLVLNICMVTYNYP